MTTPAGFRAALADLLAGVERTRGGFGEEAAHVADRLLAAERAGLRLAIALRTAAILVASIYFFSWTTWATVGVGLSAVVIFTGVGLAVYAAIGTRFDRPWLKFALYGVDAALIAAYHGFAPLTTAGDVPQILAFRLYGLPYLLPFLALSALSLSPGLVLWTGLVLSAGYLAAFAWVVTGMQRTVSWSDLPFGADARTYFNVVFDPDFIGSGSRITEVAMLMISTMIIAAAVARARGVFLAQVEAEAERAYVSETLGQYVPESVAARLLEARGRAAGDAQDGALGAGETDATILILDIAGFTAFSDGRAPREVIHCLNAFLADAADIIAEQEGVVISYLGDGLLAAFNTPTPVDRPAARAVLAAASLLREMAARRYGGEQFRFRIGLASGPVAGGGVGNARRRAFTVYGGTVNRAQRLEALGKALSQAVLMDSATAADAARDFTPGERAVLGAAAFLPQGLQSAPGLAAPLDVVALAHVDGPGLTPAAPPANEAE